MLGRAAGEAHAAAQWVKIVEEALASGDAKKALNAAEVAQSCLEYMKEALK